MSFFPVGFNPRDPSVGLLDLVSIDTVDGVFRFILGGDGRFVDVDGHAWIGCQLLDVPDLQVSLNGTAPAGSISMTYIPDPSDGDLLAELRALGTEYILDREIVFWVQPIGELSEFHAPVHAPIRWLTRKGASVAFDLSGPMERRITLNFESIGAGRNTASRLTNTTNDHAALIGEANSSLRFAPTDTFQEQKLFG